MNATSTTLVHAVLNGCAQIASLIVDFTSRDRVVTKSKKGPLIHGGLSEPGAPVARS
jgi:hypothetical protein